MAALSLLLSEALGGGSATFSHRIRDVADGYYEGLQPAQLNQALIFVAVKLPGHEFVTAGSDDLLD